MTQPFPTRSFDFSGSTPAVAKRLIGCRLLRIDEGSGRVLASGRIVETEAYLADDPASHSFIGPTARNAAMFMDAGHIYVYRIYGIHRCVNVVTQAAGIGEAVLIRALEPLSGLHWMWESRFGLSEPENPEIKDIRKLCSGPGNLTRALGITVEGFDSREFTMSGPLAIDEADWIGMEKHSITAGPRIGIRRGRGDTEPYRFTLDGSRFLSRPAGGAVSS